MPTPENPHEITRQAAIGHVHDHLIADLRHAIGKSAPPRISALHLPPSPWTGERDAEFAALELTDGSIGLAYVLLDDTLGQLTAQANGLPLSDADPLEVATWWYRFDDSRKAVGFAAINALSRWFFDRTGFRPADAGDSIGGLNPQAGEHIGMVGFFPPLIKRMVGTGARLTVLELRQELAGTFDDHRVVTDPAELQSCDKVLATSTVLLNATLDTILSHCRQARQIAMIGPGASCLPDALFARGVTFMGGVWVEDAPKVLESIRTGQRWGNAVRKTGLRAQDYPGLQQLLTRQKA